MPSALFLGCRRRRPLQPLNRYCLNDCLIIYQLGKSVKKCQQRNGFFTSKKSIPWSYVLILNIYCLQ